MSDNDVCLPEIPDYEHGLNPSEIRAAMRDYARRAILADRGRSAPAPAAWLPIEEDSAIDMPLDANVLLGWWEQWPQRRWVVEYGWGGSDRGGWRHGRATHWLPHSFLPEPPEKASHG